MSSINLGDVITIGGVYDDGTTGFVEASDKPLQLWKCVAVERDDYKLVPLQQDGSVDEFNAVAGEFWLKRKQ